jgi:acrylyl-CoA reductase (NADPH)
MGTVSGVDFQESIASMDQLPSTALGFQVWTDRANPRSVVQQEVRDLPVPAADSQADGQVLVAISHSSINYKDALAAVAHPGVARQLPLIPGIDAAGTVWRSKSSAWQVGDQVMISDEAFGTVEPGGWRQLAWVPDRWLLPLPKGLSPHQACALGTAGITAAWSIRALAEHGCFDRPFPLLVTGASGGVGSFAIEILARRLGQRVTAVTGKLAQESRLLDLGAEQVLLRDDFVDTTTRPLLSTRWAGGIDTVGSSGLATLVRSTAEAGCVTACGLAGGTDLNLTVYPFILRGVILYGIDCTRYSQAEKTAMWRQLATDWLPDQVIRETPSIGLKDVPDTVFALLENRHSGRCVVELPPLRSSGAEGRG